MKQMQPSYIKALIDLLSREDGSAVALLKEELAHIMQQNPQALHQVIEQDFHSALPLPFVHAMQEIYWDELTLQITQFVAKINPDLEEALTLASRFINPAITRDEIAQQIDALAHDLRPVLANCNCAADIWENTGRFFFHTQKYAVLPSVHDPKELSFARFLRKKQGAALCVCCLYAVCAERFGLDGGVVDLAGRVLACVQPQDSSEPLFADPLDNGRLLTLDDCKDYIFERNLAWNEAFVMPLSSRMILRRFFSHMIFILNKLRDERRLSYLRRYMDILKN